MSKPGNRYCLHLFVFCNTSPTSCQHRGCRRSQRIKSLAFSNPNRRDEHYRWRHWFTATSCDLLSSLLQHRPLPPPPSDNNRDEDDNNNEDEDNCTTRTTTKTRTTVMRKTKTVRTAMTTRTTTTNTTSILTAITSMTTILTVEILLRC